MQYKTAWVLLHKFREALHHTQNLTKLSGEIHIDGCYINHTIRPRNFTHHRIDRRAKRHQRLDKACVLVFRQKSLNPSFIKGANRSIVALIKEENTHDVAQLTQKLVQPTSKICADENTAYDSLTFHYNLWRVNHSQEYCSIDGITNNLAKSFFARFRRMQHGIHHRFRNEYVILYTHETAWREDTRRISLKARFDDLLQRCLHTKPIKELVGYWQPHAKRNVRFGLASLLASNKANYLTVV